MAHVTLYYDTIHLIQQEVTELRKSKLPNTSLFSNCILYILPFGIKDSRRIKSVFLRADNDCFKGT